VVIDDEHPHRSVYPIRIDATADYEGKLPSMETVQGYIMAVGDLYTQQCMEAGVPTDKDCIRSPEVNALLDDTRSGRFSEDIAAREHVVRQRTYIFSILTLVSAAT